MSDAPTLRDRCPRCKSDRPAFDLAPNDMPVLRIDQLRIPGGWRFVCTDPFHGPAPEAPDEGGETRG